MPMLRRLSVFFVAMALAIAMTAGPVDASATGYSGFRAPGLSGVYSAHINGSGTWVNYVSGTWRTDGGPICNVTVTAEFFDPNWRWYETRSAYQFGCSTGGTQRITINGARKRGYMCSTLRAESPLDHVQRRLTSVCHAIG